MEKYVKPTQTPSASYKDEVVETHPCYAQIGANRVQGRKVLYGSDFVHEHYITIRIAASSLHKQLGRDSAMASHIPYIEVALSEAQWATFVSTMNVFTGTQCTLTYLNRESVPQLETPPDKQEKFKTDAKAILADHVKKLAALENAIAAGNIPAKLKKELADTVAVLRANLLPNVNYIGEQFVEHMENTKEKAKIEVNAFIHGEIARAGLKSLQAPISTTSMLEEKSNAENG